MDVTGRRGRTADLEGAAGHLFDARGNAEAVQWPQVQDLQDQQVERPQEEVVQRADAGSKHLSAMKRCIDRGRPTAVNPGCVVAGHGPP